MNFQKEGKKNTFFNIKKTKKKTCSICTKDTAGRREKRDEQKARKLPYGKKDRERTRSVRKRGLLLFSEKL